MASSRPLLALGVFIATGAAALACTQETIIQRAPSATKQAPSDQPAADSTDPPPDPSPVDAGAPKKDAGGDFDAAVPPNDYAKFKPAQPSLLSSGGHLLKSPKFQVITYPNDSYASQLESYVGKIGQTSYWAATTREYGIGPGTALAPVHLTESAPAQIDDSQIRSWLAAKIDGHAPGFAPPDGNTLYLIYYPASTSITLQGTQSCQYFGGYHEEAQLASGQKVSYAVMPRCSSFGGLNGIDGLTFTTSHEIFEAATDALPETEPAYNHVDDDHFVWSYVFLSEGGDLCVQAQILGLRPADLGYFVQRTWSNQWAAAGHHPCAPGGSSAPYFNSAPVLPDTVTVNAYQGQLQVTTKGVRIPVGQSRTIDLQLFSDAPVGDFSVTAADYASYMRGQPQELQLSMDRQRGNNGDVIRLTITALRAGADGFSAFVVQSRVGNEVNFWPGLVAN